MFDAIAPRYDLVNRLMTFGLDQLWRRATIAALALPAGVAPPRSGLRHRRPLPHGPPPGLPRRRGRPEPRHAGGQPQRRAPRCRPTAVGSPSPTARSTGSSAGTPCATSPTSPPRWPRRRGCIRPGGRIALLEVDAPSSGPLRAGYDVWFTRVVPVHRRRPVRPRRLPTTCRARWPTCRPRRFSAACWAEAGYSGVGVRPLAGGLSQLLFATRIGPSRAAVTRPGPARPHRGAGLRPRPAAVRRQPDRALRPARAHPGRVGHRHPGGGRRGGRRPLGHPLRRRRAAPGLGGGGAGRPPLPVAPSRAISSSPASPWASRSEPDGATHRWATAVGPTRPAPARDRGALRRGDLAVRRLRPDRATARGRCDGHRPHHDRSRATATGSWWPAPWPPCARPDAALDKVVLARSVTAELSGPLPLSAVLRRLRAHEPACTIFSFPVPDGTFFGASPELLMARHGRRITCHPLAGHDPPRRDGPGGRRRPGAPGRLGQGPGRAPLRGRRHRRRAAPAVRRAHRAGRALAGRLPFGRPPRHPHRGAPRAATPPRPHPRAAGAGPPHPGRGRHAAGRRAGRHRRGGAGPARLLGRAGRLGRRPGRRRVDDRHPQRPARTPTARTVTLHAGAGVVADSDPEAEAAETDVKLASVLESLVPGGRRTCASAAPAPRRDGAGACGTGARGMLHDHRHPASGRRLDLRRAAEGLGDGPHDGQAEPGPRARPGGVAAVEAVEDAAQPRPGRSPVRRR